MPTQASATRPYPGQAFVIVPFEEAPAAAPASAPVPRRLEDRFVLARFLRESSAYLAGSRSETGGRTKLAAC